MRKNSSPRSTAEDANTNTFGRAELNVKTAVLVPAYNESLTIREIVQASRAHLGLVIVIDDGSTDGTAALLSDLDVRVVRHQKNLGKGHRLVEGMELALNEGCGQVITLDADGQHDPQDIPEFLECAKRNPGDLVLGDRSAQFGLIPRKRAWAIRFGNFFISWACIRRISDAQCGMRLYPTSISNDLKISQNQIGRFKFETAVLLHAAEAGIGFTTVSVDARYEGFVKRPSNFRPIIDFLKIFALVARFILTRRMQLQGLPVALGLLPGHSNRTPPDRKDI